MIFCPQDTLFEFQQVFSVVLRTMLLGLFCNPPCINFQTFYSINLALSFGQYGEDIFQTERGKIFYNLALSIQIFKKMFIIL